MIKLILYAYMRMNALFFYDFELEEGHAFVSHVEAERCDCKAPGAVHVNAQRESEYFCARIINIKQNP